MRARWCAPGARRRSPRPRAYLPPWTARHARRVDVALCSRRRCRDERERVVGPGSALIAVRPAAASTLPAHPTIARASVPPRADRLATARAILGAPDPSVRGFVRGIQAAAARHFDRHVAPIVAASWPGLAGDRFHTKLRLGACNLYASAPYTALFCAPRRPPLVRAATDLGNLLPLPLPALALLGRGAMELLGRFAYADDQRRILLISAFIVLVDHVFDHVLDQPAEERGRLLEAVIDGSEPARTPPLALTRALAVAMAEGLRGADLAAFEAAMRRMKEWIRAEVRAMRGEPDPRGLGHRLAGVEGTIDGLLFPVVRYAGEGARAWMYDVSMFVQVMDDWIDYEADAASDRPTPVVTGHWGAGDVRGTWRRSLAGLDDRVCAAGLRSPRYRRFVREAYRLMMVEVMEGMISGVAD